MALLSPATARARERPWLEAHSPHFVLVGDVGPGDARGTLFRFEQVRALFQDVSPNARLDPGQPFTIIAARNRDSLKRLLPAFFEGDGRVELAGIYLQGPLRRLVVVRADVQDDDEGRYSIAFHEYAHLIFSLNFRPLPLWLSEGMAELYANTSVRKDKVLFGRPSPFHIPLLRSASLMPLDQLIEIDHSSPLYNESDRVSLFYAQSWALAHYLRMGDRGAHRGQLSELLRQLNAGASPGEASRRALGDLRQLARTLSSYVRQQGFVIERRPAVPLAEGEVTTRALSDAEALAWRGVVYASSNRRDDAHATLRQALALAPNLPLVHETLAWLAMGEEDRDAARAHAAETARLDPASAPAHMLVGWLALSPDGAGVTAAADAFEAATRFAPGWAGAWSALAGARLETSVAPGDVVPLARRAVALEPGVLIHRFVLCQALLRAGETAEALAEIGRAMETASETEKQQLRSLVAKAQSASAPKAASSESGPRRTLEERCAADEATACRSLGLRIKKGGDAAPSDPVAALELFDKACELGEASACVDAGLIHQRGEGTPVDYGKAVPYYTRACDVGNRWGCYNLGGLHQYGRGTPRNLPRAASLYEKACGGGHQDACERLAGFLWDGEVLARDDSRASDLWEQACAPERPDSCRHLARSYLEGRGRPHDAAKALAILEPLCDGGTTDACLDLGEAYDQGRGLNRDRARALALYEKACTADDPFGCTDQAWLLLRTNTGVSDPVKGVAVARKACDLKETYACALLAAAYASGHGVARDLAKALEYARPACAAGEDEGCTVLGRLIRSREPGPAAALAREVCDAGMLVGCTELALLRVRGKGVARDALKALALFERACKGGHAPACDHLIGLLEYGEPGVRDLARAQQVRREACARGLRSDCTQPN